MSLLPSITSAALSRRAAIFCFIAATLLPLASQGQSLDIHDAVRSYATLTNTIVTMTGRSELRLSGSGDPLPGTVIHLNSPDAWLLLSSVAPSQVASSMLSRIRVNGASAISGSNLRVVQYGPGAVVIPHAPGFAPVEIFQERHFTGASRRLNSYVDYNAASLGSFATNIGSFILKRGYMATFAVQENGTGTSRCYVAQDGDLEVGRLVGSMENNVRFVRIFPWRWVGKKGVAGNIESGLNVDWLYNWNLDRNSPVDWEYVPIRQTRWWPGLDQDWRARGATHLLGYNEPDRPDQANMTVGDAIGAWPDVLWPGLRLGAPAVSDGGLGWLYDFMSQADAAGLRVDYVPVHYYRCFGNAGDPNGAASQFYNFLKGIYDVVRRPLWITEWNNGANWTSCADPSFAQQQATVAAILNMLDSTPFVERYAIYNWVEDVRRVKWDDGSLTSAGTTYRDQVSPLAYRQEMPSSGVGSSARYSFDGNARDAWGNGQDAMSVGAPVFTSGKHGQAISLNGSTDYLQLSPRMASSTDWSFAGWVYWNGGGNWQRIFDFGWDTTRYMFLTARTSSGSLRFAINNGGSEQQLSAPALTPGVWTHVAVTISGNTGKLFVNGAPVATNTSMTINPSDLGARFNYFGRSQFPADPLFSGKFDDFRFVSSALTEAQVAAIASTPPPQFSAAILHKPDAPIGQPYSASLEGDATGTGALTFGKTAGPTWLNIAANGAISGTPTAANGGINTVLVSVTDPLGSLHTATLQVIVPTITASIASGNDDAEQSATGTVTLDSTDLELVNDAATSAGDQIIGLRFGDISIPRGAVITSASIQFAADEAQSGTTVLKISAEAADDSAPFAAAANNLGARALTPFNVPWQPAPWTAGESTASQQTPNLAALVQEVVTRAGWASGNALAFLISGLGHRTADAFEKTGGRPARLTVNFSSPTPLLTVSATASESASDAEESAAGVVMLNSTDLELVNDGAAGDQIVGLHFNNVTLPANALVASASIQFAADEAQNESTALTIRAHAADSAPIFTAAAHNLSSRPVTAASAEWEPLPWLNIGERGPRQRTPDLADLVRETIARPGWSSGNAMVFLLTGTGHRTADAADEAGGLPPMLTVEYWPEVPRFTFSRWAAEHGMAESPLADPDTDGYSNLMEYALGMDPEVVNRSATSLTVDGGALRFVYTRPANVTGVTYAVEWANTVDATSWSKAGVLHEVLADDGVSRTMRASVSRGSGNRFLRLKISR